MGTIDESTDQTLLDIRIPATGTEQSGISLVAPCVAKSVDHFGLWDDKKTATKMNPPDFMARFTRFNANQPASDESIARIEASIGESLPSEYKNFLRHGNGGEGFIGLNYAVLWRVDELVRFNQEYQVHEQAPGLLLFGSNGGGEGFAFDMRYPQKPVVMVPFIGMDLREIVPLPNSLGTFLDQFAEQ